MWISLFQRNTDENKSFKLSENLQIQLELCRVLHERDSNVQDVQKPAASKWTTHG